MQLHQILDEFDNEDLKLWRMIPNLVIPPMYCTQSYEMANGVVQKIRSEALFPYSLEEVNQVLMNTKVFSTLFPEAPLKRDERNNVLIEAAWVVKDIRMNMKYHHNYVKRNNEVLRVDNEFDPDFCVYYLFCCQKEGGGSKFIVQISLDVKQIDKKEYYFYLNHGRKLIYNLAEFLRSDTECSVMFGIEKEYFQRINQTPLFSNIVCSNPRFSIMTNEDCSEIVFKGKSNYTSCFRDIIHSIYDLSLHSVVFLNTKLIKKTQKLVYLHKESPYFSNDICSTDLVYCSRVIEGNIFSACQSVKCDCKFSHKNRGFEVVLAAESIDFLSPNKMESIFYYHFRSPALLDLPLQERSRKISLLMVCLLIERIGVETGTQLNLASLQISDPHYTLVKKMMCCVLQLKTLFKSKERKPLLSVEECSQRGTFDLCKLERRVFERIAEYLSVSDLVCCMATCKKMHSMIKSYEDLWHDIYDYSMNPFTFNKYNIPTEVHLSTTQNNCTFYELVNKQKMVENKWKTKTPLIKKRIRVFEGSSVDFLCPRLMNNSFFVGSKVGRMKKIWYDSFDCYSEYILTQKLVSMEVNNDVKKLLFGLDNGKIRVYYDDFCDFYDTMSSVPFDGMKFVDKTHTLIGWKNTILRISDLQTKTILHEYKCHKQAITNGDKMNENLFITSSVDKTLMGYDGRINSLIFTTPESTASIATFDGFDDYIVGSTSDGTVFMVDMRMNKYLVSRKFSCSSIEHLFCYNRKIVFGGSERMVSYLDCRNGWFGNHIVLYQHQSPITSISFDDSLLMTGSSDGVLYYSNFSSSQSEIF